MFKAAAGSADNACDPFRTDLHFASGFATLAEIGFEVADLSPSCGAPAQDWFASVLEALPAAVYITDAQGWVTYANGAASALVGRKPVIGRDRWCVTHRLMTAEGEPLAHEHCPMAVALREGRPVRGVETMLERPDGARVPLLPLPTPLFDADGLLVGGLNVLIDISARRRAEEKLAESLRHDALTGLPNRPALSAHLADSIAQARQSGGSFVVMRMDLDGFKALNDAHGDAVGDNVLVLAARRLRARLPDIFLARIGGDEFMLVSPVARGACEATTLAQQVQSVFIDDFLCDGCVFQISVSAGCARYPQDGDDEIRLSAAANAALHLAQAHGPGSVRMFDVAEQARERERVAFRRALREAIAADEIVPHYQPLFRADGTIAGLEALARWQDPVRGMVAPATFIAAAEEAGLIAALDGYILRRACREAASWKQPLRISVNVSALEFQSGELPARVEAVLAETGLDPERLELEITEGVMVTDADRAMATFGKLRALGVRIALDDFGTGYSSLSYLHRFPLTTLKIDRSFVAKLGVTLESVAITRAIIQLGHALGIEVVAEGVETPEQLDFLIQEGCDLMQGFLLGRPLEAAAYTNLTDM